MKQSISRYIDKQSTYYGFIVYVLLVFLLPFVLITIARHVDHSFMHNYIAPYSKYKFILIILAGIITGVISNKHPLVNSVYVGLLGVLTWLVFSSISSSLTESPVQIQALLYECIKRLSLCAAGGLLAALFLTVCRGIRM